MPKKTAFDPDKIRNDALKALEDAKARREVAAKKVVPVQERLDKAKAVVAAEEAQIARLEAYLNANADVGQVLTPAGVPSDEGVGVI